MSSRKRVLFSRELQSKRGDKQISRQSINERKLSVIDSRKKIKMNYGFESECEAILDLVVRKGHCGAIWPEPCTMRWSWHSKAIKKNTLVRGYKSPTSRMNENLCTFEEKKGPFWNTVGKGETSPRGHRHGQRSEYLGLCKTWQVVGILFKVQWDVTGGV